MKTFLLYLLWVPLAFSQVEESPNLSNHDQIKNIDTKEIKKFNPARWVNSVLTDDPFLQVSNLLGLPHGNCDSKENSNPKLENVDEYLKSLEEENDFKTNRELSGKWGYDRKFNQADPKLLPSNALKNCKDCNVFDIGAGEAVALRQLLASSKNGIGCAVGVSPCKPDDHDLNKDLKNYENFHYIEKFVEDINADDLKKTNINGQADFLLDIMGAFQYSNDLSTVLEKYSSLLKTDGRVYLSFISEYKKTHSDYSSIKKGSVTKFVDSNNKEIPFADLVDSIQGFKVIHSQTVAVKDHEGDDTEEDLSYILEKTGEEVVIPKMELIELNEETTPPRRIFRVVEVNKK